VSIFGPVSPGAPTPLPHDRAPRQEGIDLSVVLPVHDEEGNLPRLWEELNAALASVPGRAEVIFVNDGSTDGSGAILDRLAAEDPRVRVIDHDRNHGLTAALDCGFHHARGAVVAMLDADLQNPPSELPRLLERLRGPQAADVVVGWRKDRRDPFVKRWTSKVANRYRNWRTREAIHDTGCALKVFRREVLERLKLWKGMHRFLPTLARMEGFRVVEVPVAHRPRPSGKSHFGTWNRLWKGLSDVRTVRWMWRNRLTWVATERRSPPSGPGRA
jgi:dolichol-phosphate mannosyltransferase